MVLALLIFLAEFALSYFADWRNVSVVSRKRGRAVAYELASSSISWGIGYYIFVESKNPLLAIPAVIGGALGTYLVASRKPKRKGRGRKCVKATNSSTIHGSIEGGGCAAGRACGSVTCAAGDTPRL